ncbi:MAG: filamentous hemagglutinin N-terminal domain-containing protein [Cyanobacteria bacterium P01_G01_bin.39]
MTKKLALISSFTISFLFSDLATVSAQIVRDNTLPNNSVILTGENVTKIEGGTTTESNLFHSFEQFSLSEGNTAWFDNALTIDNIIGRVTGDAVSNIDGLIQANGTANLFLINPNGIIFGENSALDIGGSFVGSTADSLKFADGSEFSAVNPQAPPLLTVNIPIGLQYGSNNGNLIVQGGGNQLQFNSNFTVNRNSRPRGLEVDSGKILGLIGGNVLLDGGNLTAEAGSIALGGVADNELVKFDLTKSGFNFDYSQVSNFKNINLVNASSLEVSGVGAGEVSIQGKEVIITDGSAILADTVGNLDGGKLGVSASELLVVAGTAAELSFISRLSTDVALSATGNGGDIELNSTDLIIADGAQVISSSYGAGDTGQITVNTDYLELFSGSPIVASSGLFSLVFGTGNGNNININADNILVADGGQAAALTFSDSDGGDLSIKANEIELVGVSSGGIPSSFLVNVESGATGNGGTLSIDTESLLVRDGAQIGALTFAKGDAGTIDVEADEIRLVGGSRVTGASGLYGSVELGASGNGGELIIDTESLSIEAGAQISVSTFDEGDAGTLDIEADNIQLTGTSLGGFPSGLFVNVEPAARGSGGQINLKVGKLEIFKGAQVTAVSFGLGAGGAIAVEAKEIKISGGTLNNPSGLFSAVAPSAEGSGGSLTINTNILKVIDAGQIGVSTAGIGAGGELAITAESIELKGRNEFGASGIFGNAITGQGNGGNLNIQTNSLTILDGATISVSNFASGDSNDPPGSGIAGNITISANNVELDTASAAIPSSITASTNNMGGGNIDLNVLGNISIDNSSEIDADTRGNSNGGNVNITTTNLYLNSQGRVSVDSMASGNAGNIKIDADNIDANQGRITATSQASGGGDINLATDFIALDNSEVSTSVFDGTGGGGNLEIESNYVIAQNNSRIIAQADQGAGGNIDITTKVFLLTPNTLVDASSRSGVNGAVDINSVETEQFSVFQLPQKVTDPEALIAAFCPKEEVSTFSNVGKGGLAENPRQNLRGESVWEDLRDFTDTPGVDKPSKVSEGGEIVEAKAWSINEKGNIELLNYVPRKKKSDYWALFNQCSQ